MNIFRILLVLGAFIAGITAESAVHACDNSFDLSIGAVIFLSFIVLGCVPFGVFPALFTHNKSIQLPSLSLPPFRHNCPIMFSLMAAICSSSLVVGHCIQAIYTPIDWFELFIFVAVSMGLFLGFSIGWGILQRKIELVEQDTSPNH